MDLTAAGLLATAISFWLYITAAIWYVGPWMKRAPLATALSAPLWLHAFRHIALQIFSARQFGFALALGPAREIAWGDMAGACLALAALWLLRYRARAAIVVLWAFVIESAVDLTNATVMGIHEKALDTAHAVTWLTLNFYAPLLWVSLALLVWQLVSRRGDALTSSAETGVAD